MSPLSLLGLAFLAAFPPSRPPSQDAAPEIEWRRESFDAAFAEAKRREAYLVVYFWAEWSDWCKRQNAETFADARAARAMGEFVCLDVEVSTPRFEALNQRFKPRSFPTMVFVRSDGKADEVLGGFITAGNLVKEIARIEKGQGTLTDLERQVRERPDDLEARYALGNKKWDLGDDQGYFAELGFIRASDPSGESLTRRRMDLYEMQEEVYGCQREGRELHLDPLIAFLQEERYPELLWEGYSSLADLYEGEELRNYERCRAAHMQAWKSVPKKEEGNYGLKLAWTFVNHGDGKITTLEQQLALVAASKAVEVGRKDGNAALHSQALFVYARCQEMNGQRDKAMNTLREAIELFPDDAYHREALEALENGA